MSSGGGDNGGTSTTSTQLPDWVIPYMQSTLQSYGRQVMGPNYDPNNPNQTPIARPDNLNQQVAQFTPEQLAAMGKTREMTPYTQAVANQGLGEAQKTLSGQYLSPESNPYLKGTYDAAARSVTDNYSTAVLPGIQAAAQRAGQFGGSAMDESVWMSRYGLGENLDTLATDIYGGNYAKERDRQLQTEQMLPQTLESSYYPNQQLMAVGAQQQEQEQANLDTDYLNSVSEFEYPFNLLSGLLGAATTAGGGAGTSSSITKPNGPTTFAKVKTGLSGGLSVICTELNRQGIMPDEMYRHDSEYGSSLPSEVIAGYQRWGIYVAAAMRKSKWITQLVAPIILRWGAHMQFLITDQGKPDPLGRLLLKVGIPICRWLGRGRAVQL